LFSGLLQPDFQDVRSTFLPELLPSELSSRTKRLSDIRWIGIAAFPSGVKRFGFAPYLISGKFWGTEVP